MSCRPVKRIDFSALVKLKDPILAKVSLFLRSRFPTGAVHPELDFHILDLVQTTQSMCFVMLEEASLNWVISGWEREKADSLNTSRRQRTCSAKGAS